MNLAGWAIKTSAILTPQFEEAIGAKQETRERFVQDLDMKRGTTEELRLESILGLVHSEPHDPYRGFKESCLLGGPVNPLGERELALANSYQRLGKVVKERGRDTG
ncbi:hypothetical protein BGZ51_009047 [Haplosporangium sp. Z 767]|nr:hypothetical protein BGZ51_009047 [Haplosporangium sp. Z 767]